MWRRSSGGTPSTSRWGPYGLWREGFQAAALVDGNVDKTEPLRHVGEHVAAAGGGEAGRAPANDDISSFRDSTDGPGVWRRRYDWLLKMSSNWRKRFRFLSMMVTCAPMRQPFFAALRPTTPPPRRRRWRAPTPGHAA